MPSRQGFADEFGNVRRGGDLAKHIPMQPVLKYH
jgi:hypothetical protein